MPTNLKSLSHGNFLLSRKPLQNLHSIFYSVHMTLPNMSVWNTEDTGESSNSLLNIYPLPV